MIQKLYAKLRGKLWKSSVTVDTSKGAMEINSATLEQNELETLVGKLKSASAELDVSFNDVMPEEKAAEVVAQVVTELPAEEVTAVVAEVQAEIETASSEATGDSGDA